MPSSRLDLSERYRLHALYETGMSMRAIADALERAPSTISRELRRHRHVRQYLPDHAQRLSEHRRTQASRRVRIARIELLLGEDFGPEQIAGRTGLASHEWIYRHIYADQKRGGRLFTHLRKHRRKRRRRGRWPRAVDPSAQLDIAPERGGAAQPDRRLGTGHPSRFAWQGGGGQHDRTSQSPASAGRHRRERAQRRTRWRLCRFSSRARPAGYDHATNCASLR